MVQVSVQIGFQKSQKEFQRVEAKLNDAKVGWTKSEGAYNGEFITPTSERRVKCWFMALLDCEEGDVLEVKTSVFMNGRGPDEDRTRTVQFIVNEALDPVQYDIPKLGAKGYPLASGRMSLNFEKKKIQDRIDRVDGVLEQTTY